MKRTFLFLLAAPLIAQNRYEVDPGSSAEYNACFWTNYVNSAGQVVAQNPIVGETVTFANVGTTIGTGFHPHDFALPSHGLRPQPLLVPVSPRTHVPYTGPAITDLNGCANVRIAYQGIAGEENFTASIPGLTRTLNVVVKYKNLQPMIFQQNMIPPQIHIDTWHFNPAMGNYLDVFNGDTNNQLSWVFIGNQFQVDSQRHYPATPNLLDIRRIGLPWGGLLDDGFWSPRAPAAEEHRTGNHYDITNPDLGGPDYYSLVADAFGYYCTVGKVNPDTGANILTPDFWALRSEIHFECLVDNSIFHGRPVVLPSHGR